MAKIRVLVVDDTAVIRRLVSEIVNRDPELEVVGVAANGHIALQKIPQVNPDVITLDMEMPEMDGLATIRELRKTRRDLPVIMLSSLTMRGAESTFEALAAGANDYVTKPEKAEGPMAAMQKLQELLIPCIKAHAKPAHQAPALARSRFAAPSREVRRPTSSRRPAIDIVAVATSTGGPNALVTLFEGIKKPLTVPMVVVQHMPPIFTKSLAERLDRCSCLNVCEGADGQEILPGCAYIAPGGKHMELVQARGRTLIRIHEGPPENSCRPAADVLFRSVARCYGPATLAVVMTGMGQDGLRGCEAICESGGLALAQDEATSVVWGMPSYIVKHGLADATLPLAMIASEISERVESSNQGMRPRKIS